MDKVAKQPLVREQQDAGRRRSVGGVEGGVSARASRKPAVVSAGLDGEPDTLSGLAQESVDRHSGSDQLNNRIFFRLFQLGNELQRQAVQQLGITTVQWAVLGALSQDKFAAGIPLTELGEYLVVTRQNMDGVLKRLERDGLVQRVSREGDRRIRMVQMTRRGKEFWVEIMKRIYQFYDQAAVHFTFDQKVTLVHYLNQLQVDLAKVTLPKAGRPKRNAS
ncbi:MAG: MarR family transcriptional regulator [Nevskia sp.]|nr:MarR family transcriptional regulator [Nevskia sp.]